MVSTAGCGPASPGSNPGRHPSIKKQTPRGVCFFDGEYKNRYGRIQREHCPLYGDLLMREIFIGVALPAHVSETFSALQSRANAELHFRLGRQNVVLSHGKSPFHITLVSPFTTRSLEEDDRVESGLERVSQGFVPFTVVLDRITNLDLETVCVNVRDHKHLKDVRVATHSSIRRPVPPEYVPHVSLARKFPHGRFPEILDACERAYEAHKTSFPLSFRVEGLALFVKEEDGEWKVHTTYHLRGAAAA
jgi:2'-5' RNA ligase